MYRFRWWLEDQLKLENNKDLVIWFVSLDHKRIGIIYMIMGIWGGFIGLGLRMLIRLKFCDPYYKLIPCEIYNYLITNHGIAMIFFFLMPLLIDDLALPRLNSFSV
ncbi:hypothetical protein MN116_008916 [Schistosoma mekongi]|uniref:Cytochrome c oxidase subunit 1 n=2 Tax=Schistosoma mekongi TaxID=38744 RepID=A0AAE1Z546_SCHME|nr:hypothetical protein MN116_008916 [Schistosoma mekongi]